MATNSKKIDPRFDPAFQRGYSEGTNGEHGDAVRAARSVDALRDDAAHSQFAPPSRSQPQVQPRVQPQLQVQPRLQVQPQPQPGAAAGSPEPQNAQGIAPQSHYVDDAGALAEITPVVRGKSLARNPWIYALWSVGVVTAFMGAVGQFALYGNFYGPQSGNLDLNWILPVTQSLGPTLTTLGVFCLAAAMLVHALNWMRKNP